MDYNGFLRSLDSKAIIPENDSDEDAPENSGVHKASLALFSSFLQKKLLIDFNLAEIGFYVECIDIDRDGQIGKDDLEIFIKRGSLFSKTQKINSVHSTLNKFDEKVELFPKKPLSEEVLQMVLAELRIVMRNRRLTHFDLFAKMDENKDGFVTIDELCQRLDEIITLPQEVKEGFFSCIDRLKIGIIDYHSFVRVMNKSVILREALVTEDSFDWPVEALNAMKNYFLIRKINEEDAFRMVDYDFDGTISRKDLHEFLLKALKYPKQEINQPRIERTFKLLDHYKRGYVQLEDFKRLFANESSGGSPEKIVLKSASLRSSSTGNLGPKSQITLESIHTARHFDWKINARQQIGLKLSRDYEDMKSSFDGISMHKGRMTYEIFKKWIEDNNVLQGFNLTEHLLLRLYADLDPHKKGYLVLTDWENAFSQFSWNHQILSEVQDVLYTNFTDTNTAYQYFLKRGARDEYEVKSSEIGFREFKNTIESLIPKRFSQSDLKILWEKISFGSEYLTFDHFKSFLNPNKFHSKTEMTLPVLSSPKRQGEGSSIYSASLRHSVTTKALLNGEDFLRGVYASDVFDKLKQYIRAGKNSIVELFKDADHNHAGRITSLEFRNVIKRLNLGFTSIQINQLLDFADVLADGTIDFNSFINRILLKESEARIFNRVQERLKSLKHNIKGYLITPKDAFQRFNKNDNGRLTYEEFTDFMAYLCKMSGEDLPALSIIRDLFDFIDVKKDGIIDLNEWLETFNHITGIEAKEEKILIPKHQIAALSKDYISYNTPDWENTKNYDEVMKAIGRNRKLIFGKFMNLEQRKVKINFEASKEILKEVLTNCKLKVEDKNWPTLISFAEKDGKVDYRLLLDVYRQRVQKIMDAPKAKIIYL